MNSSKKANHLLAITDSGKVLLKRMLRKTFVKMTITIFYVSLNIVAAVERLHGTYNFLHELLSKKEHKNFAVIDLLM